MEVIPCLIQFEFKPKNLTYLTHRVLQLFFSKNVCTHLHLYFIMVTFLIYFCSEKSN